MYFVIRKSRVNHICALCYKKISAGDLTLSIEGYNSVCYLHPEHLDFSSLACAYCEDRLQCLILDYPQCCLKELEAQIKERIKEIV